MNMKKIRKGVELKEKVKLSKECGNFGTGLCCNRGTTGHCCNS